MDELREAKIAIVTAELIAKVQEAGQCLGLTVSDSILRFRICARLGELRLKYSAEPFDTTGAVQRVIAEEIAMCGKVPGREA